MNNLIDKFTIDVNIEALKYLISKQIFCTYSGKGLDYRNAIMYTVTKDDSVASKVVHGSFYNKIPEAIKAFKKLGFEVEVFVHIKKVGITETLTD